MKKSTLQVLDQIVRASDIQKSERLDLRDELISHIEASKSALIKQGFSDEQAEEQALLKLGTPEEIGEEIQQAVYPYRKSMLYNLAGFSLGFTFITYLMSLFINFDAHMIWLILSLLINLAILFTNYSHNPLYSERYILNLLLVSHLIIHFYALLILLSIDHFSSFILLSLWLLIFLLSLTLIYRVTAIDSTDRSDVFEQTTHILNFILAFFIVGLSLFVAWAFTAFGLVTPSMILLILPTLIWLGLYIIQIKALELGKRRLIFLIFLLEFISVLGFTFLIVLN